MHMDSPTQPVASVRSNVRERRAILITIIVVAIILLGWLAYVHFKKSGMSAEEQRAAVMSQIADQSSAANATPDAAKPAILGQVSASSAPSSSSSSSSTEATPQQRADIMSSLSSQ